MDDFSPSVYDRLIGTELVDGWTVTGRAEYSPPTTGGTFSVCFDVSQADGRKAFCKLFDFETAYGATDLIAAVQELTADFKHEVTSLEVCKGLRMRRVVLALNSETQRDHSYPMGVLSYIIFEPATGDLRIALPDRPQADDLQLRFELLHDVAVGIAELHRAGIMHQDLKPSNILAIASPAGRSFAKVADLGRAVVGGRPYRFDDEPFPGDVAYAPPEYFYGEIPKSYDFRRRGTDLYQLGGLITFVLTGSHVQSLIYEQLPPSLRWDTWSGDYLDVEPSVREATVAAIEMVAEDIPPWAVPPVSELLMTLCDSDPSRRSGSPHRSPGAQFSLNRAISVLDRLSKQAAVEKAKAS